ncbi:hypothetical protein BU24DRAFT_450238 [Aaosphaeria arxii CBS 175.79]|uniref:F-box domain-containing protein n=1 Tax=Aaosphaeria arxii CBS 175.79 TaxID=1450172 RepID=A0A6A5XRH9_9PLEO|nr:uncharacterized protein BU24DRAFT_450238 [Aaosphaeria arxii CBS 175.79]KAF2015543.1 hypothetical protein BU24DRAFT_450238 [Aaosphaeria arxii CBS 175.79]
MSPQEISTENLNLQQTSSFFRLLPRELRDMIYGYMENEIRHDWNLGTRTPSPELDNQHTTHITMDVEVLVKDAPYVHVLQVCKRMYFEYRQSLACNQVFFNVTVDPVVPQLLLWRQLNEGHKILPDTYVSYDFLDPVIRRALRIEILINCTTFDEYNVMIAQERLIKILSPKTTKLESLRLDLATHGFLYHITPEPEEPEEPKHKDGNNYYAQESASLPYWSNKEIMSHFRETRSGIVLGSVDDSLTCSEHRDGVNRSWRDKRANVLDWYSEKGCYTAPETDMD